MLATPPTTSLTKEHSDTTFRNLLREIQSAFIERLVYIRRAKRPDK